MYTKLRTTNRNMPSIVVVCQHRKLFRRIGMEGVAHVREESQRPLRNYESIKQPSICQSAMIDISIACLAGFSPSRMIVSVGDYEWLFRLYHLLHFTDISCNILFHLAPMLIEERREISLHTARRTIQPVRHGLISSIRRDAICETCTPQHAKHSVVKCESSAPFGVPLPRSGYHHPGLATVPVCVSPHREWENRMLVHMASSVGEEG